MSEHLGILEILGIAGSVSLLSGWRLYLCVLATGLAMQFGALQLPAHLQSLQVLANPWVMGAAGAALLGGGATLLAHGGKAGARAVVNTSPEPFTNVAVSTTEDLVTGGLLYLAFANPALAGLVALGLLILTVWLLLLARRVLKRIFGPAPEQPPA